MGPAALLNHQAILQQLLYKIPSNNSPTPFLNLGSQKSQNIVLELKCRVKTAEDFCFTHCFKTWGSFISPSFKHFEIGS